MELSPLETWSLFALIAIVVRSWVIYFRDREKDKE